MRIVFVLPRADSTGGVRAVAIYARALVRNGHKVTIVARPAPTPTVKEKVKSLLRGRGWPRTPPPEPSHVTEQGVELVILDRFRPVTNADVPDADVVIATWWLTAEWVAALSPRKGVKVHFAQGNDADLPGQPTERVEAVWRLPFHRIVCSRWMEEFAASRGVRATCVPNGVDAEHFSAPARSKQERPTVGMVYSDVHVKGCDIGLEAFRLASLRVPGLRLVSFGSIPVSSVLPLPDGVDFTYHPEQSLIPALYAGCDAWLWPSRREGFGLPILEAMACGTPVIAAPAGAAPELLSAGGGILLAAAEASAMAAAIEKVVALPPEGWARLSAQARDVAVRHGWDESARRFEAALLAAHGEGVAEAPNRAG
jgi:glycosyltransferase involved in cell wall biosynthesis